jgi:hypothetical protein
MTTAFKSDAPIHGANTNAHIEINAANHRTLGKFIVVSLDFTKEDAVILKCS